MLSHFDLKRKNQLLAFNVIDKFLFKKNFAFQSEILPAFFADWMIEF
jgi:hypothetical protein